MSQSSFLATFAVALLHSAGLNAGYADDLDASAGERSPALASANEEQIKIDATGRLEIYISVNSTDDGPSATGRSAIAIGEGARATATNSVAIGTRTQARFENSVALGIGAQVQRDRQIMLGSRSSTYTMPGLTSPGSRTYQTGALELVTVDSEGNLASDGGDVVQSLSGDITANQSAIASNAANIDSVEVNISALQSQADDTDVAVAANSTSIDSVQQHASSNSTQIDLLKAGYAGDSERFETVESKVEDHQERMLVVDATVAQHTTAITANSSAIGALQADVGQLRGDVDSMTLRLARTHSDVEENTIGIAIANALAGSSWLQSNESVAFSLNAGYFDGSTAVAFSGAARLHKKWSANVAIGSVPSHGDIGARAGLRVGW